MAIPFKSLRFSYEDQQTWGIALSRRIVRGNENSFWPYITLRTPAFVPQLARLEGLQSVSPGRNIQIIPYTSFTNAHFLDGRLGEFRREQDWRGGFDAKAVLRNSLTFDLTVRPDFSQVESDDPQVTINQRFEVFFPEKRPFFIENANYFETPLNLFFSRRIVDPETGARLTGKVGQWAIGILAADDLASGTLSGGKSFLGNRAGIGVARIQREFASQSRIGFLATSRDFGSSSNRLFSLDTRLKFSPNWFFTGQVARSFDRQADTRLRQGGAYWANVLRTGSHFTYTGGYLDFSPYFRPQLGFVPRVDLRQTQHYMAYFWRPEGHTLLSFGPSLSTLVNWNTHGRLQDWLASADFSLDFSGPSSFRISRLEGFSLYLNRPFRFNRSGASFQTAWLRWLHLYGSYGQGTAINYNPRLGLPPFLGSSIDASFGFFYQPTSRFRFDELYIYNRLGMLTQGSIFNNHLTRTKVNYQFTRALSARIILDYNGILPNSSLIAQQEVKQLTGDFLLTYLLHHGTAVYVGYNNRHENLLLDPTGALGLQRFGPPTKLGATQWFVKLSYLFGL
jgi:hypothetical protein